MWALKRPRSSDSTACEGRLRRMISAETNRTQLSTPFYNYDLVFHSVEDAT